MKIKFIRKATQVNALNCVTAVAAQRLKSIINIPCCSDIETANRKGSLTLKISSRNVGMHLAAKPLEIPFVKVLSYFLKIIAEDACLI